MSHDYAKRIRGSGDLLARGVASGNISQPLPHEERELVESSPTTRQEQDKHLKSLQVLEIEKLKREMPAPFKDEDIKLALRAVSEPICLFGERLVDRRERLKGRLAELQVLARSNPSIKLPDVFIGQVPVQSVKERVKIELRLAEQELIEARMVVAKSSWETAKARLGRERLMPVPQARFMEDPNARVSQLEFEVVACQNEVRPVSCCALSEDGRHVVTGSFDQTCRIYCTFGDYKVVNTLVGHENRICDVAFRPSLGADQDDFIVASGSSDGEIRLWKNENTVAKLSGHVQRVGRLNFDCTGRWLCSTSFDHTWRFWDAQVGKCLFAIEGHTREVYTCSFHPDGALVMTADMAGVARVWDIRSGKATHIFKGHALGILCSDFSMNGYTAATGGLDDQVRTWDLRKKECIGVIPAHLKPVTECKFSPRDGKTLFTSSQDHCVRAWSVMDNWKRIGTIVAHEASVMAMDVAADEKLVTVGYDRAIKFLQTKREDE